MKNSATDALGGHVHAMRADPTIGLVVETFGGTDTLNGDEYVEIQEYADATWRKDKEKALSLKSKLRAIS